MCVSNELLCHYYDHEAEALKRLVDFILKKNQFDWVKEKPVESDEVYSLASEVLYNSAQTWNPEMARFETYLTRNIENKIKSMVTAMNRKKRGGGTVQNVSMDEFVDEDNEVTRGDQIASDFSTETIAIDRYIGTHEKSNADRYMSTLSKTERKIVEMLLSGCRQEEIMKKLNLKKREFNQYMDSLRSVERKRLLVKDMVVIKEEMPMLQNNNITTTTEVSKETSYTAAYAGTLIHRGTIRDDHPQQRQSGQWSNIAKGDLIVTMLHGYTFPKIVLAEQTVNGSTVRWLVDGKQRLTTITSFRENGFRLSKRVQRPIIRYQKPVLGENGKQVFNNGFPVIENIDFDVAGKTYKQLPEELQDRIDNYMIGVDLYLNCDDEEVGYHILRFNQAKTMTAAQKGITHLGRELAQVVKRMVTLPFFADELGTFTRAEFSNGAVERVITESIMAIFFLSNWKKNQNDANEFLKANATAREFNKLEEYMERIADVGTEGVKDMFTSKDTFIWFAAFARYDALCGDSDDERFLDFMRAFKDELHAKEINGVSYDGINGKATKDKSVIVQKVELLEALMCDYFHINKEETLAEFDFGEAREYIEAFSETDFCNEVLPTISETEKARIAMKSLLLCCGLTDFSDKNIQDTMNNFSPIMDEKKNDIILYLGDMEQHSLNMDKADDFYEPENIPAIVALYDYVYENDIAGNEFDQWMVKYAENFSVNNNFTKDLIGNRNIMIEDFNKYLTYAA